MRFYSLVPLIMKFLSKLSLSVSVAILVAGCAVKPKPFTQQQLADFTGSVQNDVAATSQSPSGAIDLNEALARAIKYNQDIRVEQLGIALGIAQTNLRSADMLPGVVAGTDYFGRNNLALSRSNVSSVYSTSSDQNNVSSNISLSWNILDFGLSYVRAQQAADKVMYQVEQRRRAVGRIIEETRSAYWRAVSLERLVARMEALQKDVNQALALAQAGARNPSIEPLPALSYQRDLLTIQRELDSLRGSLIGAHEHLKQLINMPQHEPLHLKADRAPIDMPLVRMSPDENIQTALDNRPEIRQLMYEMRINNQEAKVALLEMLPGINLSGGSSKDASSFLYHSNWVSWGAKASWNLINVFRYPLKINNVKAQNDLNQERAVALAVAISAQVYVARARYTHNITSYQNAVRYTNVQKQIVGQTHVATRLGRMGEQSLVRERMATILAEAKQDMAYADLQNAYAGLLTSIGLDMLDYGQLHDVSVEQIAEYLRETARESRESSAKIVAAHSKSKAGKQ